MPLQGTSGAASQDAFGGSGVAVVPNFIEEVFSCFLYTGTGATQTITNNIDLSTKGGLTWIKGRSGATGHRLTDTARGATKSIASNSTAAEATESTGLTAFGTTGFTIGADADYNTSADTYVSWTFREQPKFFDVVTYSGDANSSQIISHNLGAVPGCMIIRPINAVGDWPVYHRSMGNTSTMWLNQTGGINTQLKWWNNTSPTATQFTVGNDSDVNASGRTYVAYLFAHDAGGFGTAGTDNVISCGSFTTNGSGVATVSLGYEPQWVLIKRTDDVDSWYISDNMRGLAVSGNQPNLIPDGSYAELVGGYNAYPNATGFTANVGIGSSSFIYIAIRRGPMKVPTDPNNVFALNLAPDTSTAPLTWTTYSTVDSVLTKRNLSSTNGNNIFIDRLRGNSANLLTNTTAIESTNANITDLTISNGYIQKLVSTGGAGGAITYAFSRAPSVFDIVCYTGTGSATTFNHNLGVVPEMMIVRLRNFASNWQIYHKDLSAFGTEPADESRINLNNTNAATTNNLIWDSTPPTSTVFSVGGSSDSNRSGNTIVNYLFATCAGVSKVGSYTGNGSNQTINCGFTAGTRFVLIRRTDSTGDWYVWDSARGIVAGNDPHLSLNDTAAEVTTDDSVDTNSTGFVVNQNSATNINVTSATYIFLAMA